MKKNIVKHLLINFFTILFSFLIGIIFHDYWIGPISLACGILNSYYMIIGKWQNYIYGIIFSVIYSIGCYINGLYGMVIFTVLVYTPLQVFGIINWAKNKKEEQVEMKSLNFSKSCLLCVIMIASSFLLGFLLSLIPTQNLAFLDSTSQILNLGGVILISIRFREGWYVWLANNLVDLVIWTINMVNQTPSSELLFITSIMYLASNVVGIISWIKIEKKQKNVANDTAE